MLLACRPADLVVVDAKPIGTVPRSAWIEGRDGGGSGYAFGKSVWVYGDTVLVDLDEDGTNWHTNSFDLGDPNSWMSGFETPVDSVGAPRFFVELSPEEQAWNDLHAAEDCPEAPCSVRWALWPSAPIWDAARERAWILYGLYNDEFESGIGVASWAGLDQPVVRLDLDGSWLLFPGPEPEWANAPVVDGEWLYTFGCPREGLEHRCMLARVPIADPSVRADWRFWTGDEWSTSMTAAEVLFEGAPIMQVSYAEGLDRWLLIYSKPFDEDVVARTATRIEGPWSHEEVLFRVEGESAYDALHHPELEQDDGLVQFISYSQPTSGWFGSEHLLWRVELAKP